MSIDYALNDYDIFSKKFNKNPVDCIIHCGWSGVHSLTRDEVEVQISNLVFLNLLLKLAKEKKVEKFISLGSQAEYGIYDGIIDETHETRPNSYYGISKLTAKNITELYCYDNNIKWYWLRLFPMFGERESYNWFIPSLIKKLTENNNFDMTKGEQIYSYLYVEDFANWMALLIESNASRGVYNICSKSNLIALKDLALLIVKEIGLEKSTINIGALPYRENQPMLMAGKIDKLEKELGELHETSFDYNLKKVVNYFVKS